METSAQIDIYLVGGAVRDRLLGLAVQDRDYVVVGATPEWMLQQGYRPVGADFPVFLHPVTHSEYALARTERKTAPGYKGFVIHAEPGVTLEQDLRRRDLTINAMAEDEQGRVIDPYGGQQDLDNRMLRHVSPAFAEDPLRILRVARFAARFAEFGFSVAPETMQLMHQMVESGEVDALVAERVWAEMERALSEDSPSVFFSVLRDCGALARILPELDALFGVPQPARYHPEIDTGVHTLMVLDQAVQLSQDVSVRFAALTHDLGKGLTPEKYWPSHRGHETTGLAALNAVCERLRVPKAHRELAERVMQYHTHCHRVRELKSKTLYQTLVSLDVFRRPELFEKFLLACEADARGRTGFEQEEYPQSDYFRKAHRVAAAIDAKQIVEQGFTGKAVRNKLDRLRIDALASMPR